MSRYFLNISFLGTPFHGWQKQQNAHTVQQEIETALSTLCQEKMAVMGCGRTDTGVHAKVFYLHFDTEKILDNTTFIMNLNGVLRKEIAVHEIIKVKDDAHVRFDAVARTYEYHIHKRKDPFKENLSAFVGLGLNLEKMNTAAKSLMNHKDFSCFSKSKTQTKTNLCELSEAHWKLKNEHEWVFTITANRFLRNMVRAIVGTLLEVGKNKLSIDEFEKIIESKDRRNAGASVPACGLYLCEVNYEFLTSSEI